MPQSRAERLAQHLIAQKIIRIEGHFDGLAMGIEGEWTAMVASDAPGRRLAASSLKITDLPPTEPPR